MSSTGASAEGVRRELRESICRLMVLKRVRKMRQRTGRWKAREGSGMWGALLARYVSLFMRLDGVEILMSLIQDCQTPLRDEYYDFNGRSYCHQHVMRAFHNANNAPLPVTANKSGHHNHSNIPNHNNNQGGGDGRTGGLVAPGGGFVGAAGNGMGAARRHPERRTTRLMMM